MNKSDYAKLIEGKTCRWCEYPLPTEIKTYNHGAGWRLDGYAQRQWLYVECRRCDYEWSLAKLGIPRSIGDIRLALVDADGARHDISHD